MKKINLALCALVIFAVKTTKKICDDWLVAIINDKCFDVLFEDYNVVLRKEGEIIFDKRRFEDKEFLSLLN